MKFVHLGDLHIGKRLDSVRLIEDQEHILKQIVRIIKDEMPDAVLIAGDVYDRGVPPAEAVTLLDGFIVELSEIRLPSGKPLQTFIIAGNHDSPERLSFANLLLGKSGIHISPIYNGKIEPFVIDDEFGQVNIYMLPFIKPVHVRDALTDMHLPTETISEIDTYTKAAAKAIELTNVDETKRSIIISHQFVQGGSLGGSETVSVGGLDVIDVSVYEKFNYVALGHLHKPQTIKTPKGNKNLVYYCGSPLKYSFSETTEKSVAVVEMDGEGSCSQRFIPLVPLFDMRTIEKSFEDIKASNEHSDDYIRVVLTDKNVSSNVYYELQTFYPNLLKVIAKNNRNAETEGTIGADITSEQSEMDIFRQFFELMNEREPDEDESSFIETLFDRAKDSLMDQTINVTVTEGINNAAD